ncbi:MAG: hypothetical protein WAL50_19690, partial [Kineosporiaceae bacterium]
MSAEIAASAARRTGRAVRELAIGDAAGGVLPRFRAVLEAQPEALAVADGDRSLTYAQLAAEAVGVLRAVRGAVPAGAP